MSCVIHALRGVASALTLVLDVPGVRPVGNVGIGRMRLPTEAVGLCTGTFLGINTGSEIHVYLPDGVDGAADTEVAGVEACAANQELTWPVYAAGSPNNNVYITIIKRGIGWRKFRYQSKVGAQSMPIFQSTDLGYNNPT